MSKTVKYVKLKELCTVNQGLQIPIEKRFKEKKENRYFYVTVQFLKDSYKEKYYIENPPKSSICKKDDILVVRTGNTGQIITGIDGCFHNNFFKINYDKNKVFGRYLYYCLITKEKQKEMAVRAGITTIPDLNHFMFLDMKIPLIEDLIQQEKISHTLDLINAKIELNNRINIELEAMVKTLYNYWFVQFDFPNEKGKPYKSSGGEMVWSEELKKDIPKDWKVKKLDDLFEFTKGIEPGSSEYLDSKVNNDCIKFFRVGDIEGESIVYVDSKNKIYITAEARDIIVTFDGSVGKLGFGLKGAFSSGLRKIYDKSKKFDNSLVYFIFRDEKIVATIHKYATGSILLHASSSIEHLVIPFDENTYLKFQETVKPIFDQMVKNKQENQKLTELRDWLLPMLMNGQVTVK